MCINGLGVGLYCEGEYALASLVFHELIEYSLTECSEKENANQILAVAHYNLAVLKLSQKEMIAAKINCSQGINVCKKGGCNVVTARELYRLMVSIDIINGNKNIEENLFHIFKEHQADAYNRYDSFHSFVYDRHMLIA